MTDQSEREKLRSLAQSLIRMGEDLSRLVADWRDSEFLRDLAYEYFAHPEISTRLFRRLQELEPENAQVAADLGFVYWLIDDRESAAAQVERARQIDPLNVQGLLLLASLAPKGPIQQAAYRRVLEIDPENTIAREFLEEPK